MKVIWLLTKIVFLPYLIIFWIMKVAFSPSGNSHGSKSKKVDSKAPGSTGSVVALLVGGLAAKKLMG